jgi:hypothetical protein
MDNVPTISGETLKAMEWSKAKRSTFDTPIRLLGVATALRTSIVPVSLLFEMAK